MTTAPITPLTPAERRVADHLVRGLEPRAIAAETGLSSNTVSSYVRTIRAKLHCPTRSAPHVLVHHLLSSGQATPPSATEPTPDLTPARRLLLRAFAEHTSPYDVARDARIAPADVRAEADTLLAETGADDATRLVVLAHVWGFLGAGRETTIPAEARR
ncbi:helix-turn-helix transcriptional regulator [Streptomyces cathayae]|uniref:Helix-turn-helix transcriptional regulator n=1 Tax=Streptomyces cathayae TaxID=3031124 RepID=A0ABY8JYG7_9ACTN|nr:helix-turn-helix transcriptional regulator [Streptomyces sp. HUAS 5]WGD39716.1 helix-turn-helix transcriptional regulator [Streptomyces sp. HUAS 5]